MPIRVLKRKRISIDIKLENVGKYTNPSHMNENKCLLSLGPEFLVYCLYDARETMTKVFDFLCSPETDCRDCGQRQTVHRFPDPVDYAEPILWMMMGRVS
jgi:hypothetical protein